MAILSSIFRNAADTNTMTTGTLEQIMRSLVSSTSSGIPVTPDTALRTSAVFACTKVISETAAQIPIYLYRVRKGGGKDKVTDDPLAALIGLQTNPLQNSFQFRETGTIHTLLRGNFYAIKNRVGMGRVAELNTVHPDLVTANLTSYGEREYRIAANPSVSGAPSETRTLPQSEVFHLMGMSLNGWQGITPVSYARESIGLSQATERYGGKLFSNGAKMGGILTYPGRFKDSETARNTAIAFDMATNGENAHRTITLEDGAKWQQVTMTADDSQFLETRGFQVPEIARFFRMPLHKIQDMTASTNNNIEQQALEFISDCMMPWFLRWEYALNTQLIVPRDQGTYFFKFDVDEFLRADMVSRFTAYSQGITAKILNPNECREKEDMNPYAGGDKYENPAITPGQGGQGGST